MLKESHNYDHDHNHKEILDIRNVKLAFFLNTSFAIIEFFGALLSNSITLYSNSIHDLGDSVILFFSILLEKKSANPRNEKYTYGYRRFATLANVINCVILIVGALVIYQGAISRLYNPEMVRGDIMFVIALFGMIVNAIGAYKIYKSGNKNHKSLYLNIASDAVSWVCILFSSLMIILFDITIFDSVFSILLATWLLYSASKEIKTIIGQLMQSVPNDIDINEITKFILQQDGIIDVHDFHIWDLDGTDYISSFHIVVKEDSTIEETMKIKEELKKNLEKLKINHATIEADTYHQAVENGEL